MADLRDLESLSIVSERASTETAPPPFDDLVRRASVRRGRRAGAVTALVVAGVAVAAGLGAFGRGAVVGPERLDVPATAEPAQENPSAELPPADPRATELVATGLLFDYDVDARGDLLSTWSSCPDTSSCRFAWRLVRSDGTSTAGMYPGREGGPHVSAGADYFTAAWYTGPHLLVGADGTTSRVAPAQAGTGAGDAGPGAATVVTMNGVRLVDRESGRWLGLQPPTGRAWNTLEIAEDGTVWGVDEPGVGERSTVSWLPAGGSWQEEQLRGPGTGALVRSGDRVAALSLGAVPAGERVTAPSFGSPTDYAVTTDAGRRWTHPDPDGLPFDSLESWAATADGTLLVSDGKRVYRSTDGTWLRFEPVPGADSLNRLRGGDGEHPDRVYGYSYDHDRLFALTSDGGVQASDRQLR